MGKSLLDRVEEIHSDDYVVLELSSFQLEDTANLPWSPQVAVVTNFAPNHLDRHKTLENYRAAKQNILRSQSASDRAILNTDDVDVWSWPATGTRIGFGITDPGSPGVFLKGKQVLFRSENQELLTSLPEWVPLPGAHNLANALAAAAAIMPRPKQPAAATWSIGTPIEQIEQGLRTYRALPHRLELITERGGRRFYNDSLATTPESAQMALRSFDAPIVLLAGGYDKGIDLTDFVREITQSNVRGVAWMGQLGQGLEQTRVSLDPMNKLKTRVCLSFPEAMQFAVNVSQPGDVILLSPGCASYDWFQNFADRGQQFASLAREISIPAKEDTV